MTKQTDKATEVTGLETANQDTTATVMEAVSKLPKPETVESPTSVGFPEDFWELVRAARSVARQEISDRRQYLHNTRAAQHAQQRGVPMPKNFFEHAMSAAQEIDNAIEHQKLWVEAKEAALKVNSDASALPARKNSSLRRRHQTANTVAENDASPTPTSNPTAVTAAQAIATPATETPTANLVTSQENHQTTDNQFLNNSRFETSPSASPALETTDQRKVTAVSAEEVDGPFQVTSNAIANNFQYLEGLNLALPILAPNLGGGSFGNLRDDAIDRHHKLFSVVANSMQNKSNTGSLEQSAVTSQAVAAPTTEFEIPNLLNNASSDFTADQVADQVNDYLAPNEAEVKRRYYAMSMKEAAYQILRQEKRPMTAKEIVEKAIQQGLIQSTGKTPEATLASQINRAINTDDPPCFVKLAGRTYAINWLEDKQTTPPPVTSPSAVMPVAKAEESPHDVALSLATNEDSLATNNHSLDNVHKMTFKEVALYLLARERRPMTTEELATLAIAERLITQVGKTPNVTMAGRLSDAYRSKSYPRLQRVGPNTYLISDADPKR
jgi:hypothetical protein